MKAQRAIAQSSLEEDAVEAMRTLELGLCDKCDVILYPSDEEAKLMGSLVSRRVRSISIPAYRFDEAHLNDAEQAADRIKTPSEKAQLLFVGGFSHGPNVDGTVWFCREVAPILRREGFAFELQIAGSNPTAEIWDLESEDVQVLGFVSDKKLRSLYREANAVIAPLRFGAGVKGKVVEAMAHGVPVATTRVGAQGLAGAGDYLFLGDTAEEFAAALRAAVDSEVGKVKAKAGIEYVRTHYSRAAMVEVLLQVLPSVASVSKSA
jgi:glycosyltransferase involved in cell wall biosynthesis